MSHAFKFDTGFGSDTKATCICKTKVLQVLQFRGFSSDDEYFEDEYIYGDGTLDEEDEDEENRSVISDTPVVTMTDMDEHETRPRAASEGGSPCGSLEKDVSFMMYSH